MVSTDRSSTEAPLTLKAEAKVAEGDDGEQGANWLATGWDAKEVANMAKVVSDLAEGWSDRTFAVKLLRGLCALAIEHPHRLEPDPSSRHWGFIALEIGEALNRLGIRSTQLLGNDPSQSTEHAQQSMKSHWPKLLAVWERESPTIVQRLSERKVSLCPTPFRHIGGGSGNPTRFGFRLARTEDIENQQPSSVDWLNIPNISYQQADISGNRLIQWFSDQGLYLSGRIGRVYLGIAFVLFLGGLFLLWSAFVAMTYAPTTLDFLKISTSWLVILALGYLVFGWQVRLVANRVTLAPLLLQPFASRYDDYLLELRPDEETKRNSLYLVRYVANCPICGEKGRETVHIASGRREFFGRLVGRCRRSPNEHVFSFDHTTRQGRYLR